MRQLLLYGLVYFKNNLIRAGVGSCCHNYFAERISRLAMMLQTVALERSPLCPLACRTSEEQ